jgi:hypothetical protein
MSVQMKVRTPDKVAFTSQEKATLAALALDDRRPETRGQTLVMGLELVISALRPNLRLRLPKLSMPSTKIDGKAVLSLMFTTVMTIAIVMMTITGNNPGTNVPAASVAIVKAPVGVFKYGGSPATKAATAALPIPQHAASTTGALKVPAVTLQPAVALQPQVARRTNLALQPASQPAARSAAQPAAQPAPQPAAQPAPQSAAQPAPQSAAQPAPAPALPVQTASPVRAVPTPVVVAPVSATPVQVAPVPVTPVPVTPVPVAPVVNPTPVTPAPVVTPPSAGNFTAGTTGGGTTGNKIVDQKVAGGTAVQQQTPVGTTLTDVSNPGTVTTD